MRLQAENTKYGTDADSDRPLILRVVGDMLTGYPSQEDSLLAFRFGREKLFVVVMYYSRLRD